MNILQAGHPKYWEEDKRFKASINLLSACNFSCSYCNFRGMPNTILPEATVSCFIDILATQSSKEIALLLSGGEPTLYPHMDSLLKTVSKKLHNLRKLTIITNGSFLFNEKKLEVFDILDPKKVNLSISLHYEQIDYQKMIHLISKYMYRDHIILYIFLNPNDMLKIQSTVTLCEENGIHYNVLPLYNRDGTIFSYSDEEKEYLNILQVKSPKLYFNAHNEQNLNDRHFYSNFDKVLDPTLIEYKGMICSAGSNSMLMNNVGKIKRCPRDIQAWNIETMTDKDYSDFFSPTICKVERCACARYLSLPKWRNSQFAPTYIKA